MMTFQKLEGSIVILCKNGVYSQHEAWHRRKEVFVKVGSNFQGMRRDTTSVQGVRVEDYDLGDQEEYAFTALGRMVIKGHPKAEEEASSTKLGNNAEEQLKEAKKKR